MEEIVLSDEVYVSDMVEVLVPFLKKKGIKEITVEYFDIREVDDNVVKVLAPDELESYVNENVCGKEDVWDFSMSAKGLEIRYDGDHFFIKGELTKELVAKFN